MTRVPHPPLARTFHSSSPSVNVSHSSILILQMKVTQVITVTLLAAFHVKCVTGIVYDSHKILATKKEFNLEENDVNIPWTPSIRKTFKKDPKTF